MSESEDRQTHESARRREPLRATRVSAPPHRVVLDHLSIQCADPAASRAFYEKVLVPLGGKTIMTFGNVHGMGVDFPCFWLGPVGDAGVAHKDIHICFRAQSRDQVDAFVDAARAEGVEVLHKPRVWPQNITRAITAASCVISTATMSKLFTTLLKASTPQGPCALSAPTVRVRLARLVLAMPLECSEHRCAGLALGAAVGGQCSRSPRRAWRGQPTIGWQIRCVAQRGHGHPQQTQAV